MTEIQSDGTNELVTQKYKGYDLDWTNSFATDIHRYHLEGPDQIANDELTEVSWNNDVNGIRLFVAPSPLIKVEGEYKEELEWTLVDALL
jgi:hypothetical protein